jgi:hypothetical protein
VESRYLIEELTVHGSRIVVTPHPRFRTRFLREDFFVEYDSGVPLADIDDSLLAIPFLLNVIPLVWASGDRYRIAALDAPLASALEQVRAGFRRLYPKVSWNGQLVADTTVAGTPTANTRGIALLFSGGADSVYSSLTHRGEPERWITILSSLGSFEWQNSQARAAAEDHFRRSAATSGRECSFVTSNLRQFIDEAKLVGVWPDPRRWMIEVQHGLGFAGLCAPLMSHFQIRRLLVASCERDHYGLPGGSHPDIVNAIRWSGAQAFLDGFEKTRQEKIRAIRKMLPELGRPPTLKPCLHPVGGFENCCACAKCLQTMLGILAEGDDPRPYGFSMGPPFALSAVRSQISARRLQMPDAGELLQWQEIQASIRARLDAGGWPGLPDLKDSADLLWFASLDLAPHFDRCRRGPRGALRRLRGRLGLLLDRRPALGEAVRRLLRPML